MSGNSATSIDLDFTPPDLIWSLSQLNDKDRGRAFLLGMSEHLPIYSASVRQLYLSYDVGFAGDNAVIIPHRYSFTETYSRIEAENIRHVGIQLLPTSNGIEMAVKKKDGGTAFLPISMGLRLVQKRLGSIPFLPVIQKGDLREYSLHQPALQLHALDIRGLHDLSQFNKMDITRAIHAKL